MKKKSRTFNSLKNKVEIERNLQKRKEESKKIKFSTNLIRKKFKEVLTTQIHLTFEEALKHTLKLIEFSSERDICIKEVEKAKRILLNQQAKDAEYGEFVTKMRKMRFDVRKSSVNSYSIEEVIRRRDEQKVHPSEYSKNYYTSVWWKTFSKHYLKKGDRCEKCKYKYASEIHHQKKSYSKTTFYEDKHVEDILKLCGTCHMKIHGK